MPEPFAALASRPQRLALAVVALVAALGAVNWALNPDAAARAIRAMLVLPAAWLVLAIWQQRTLRSLARRDAEDHAAVRSYFGSAIALVFVAAGSIQIVRLALSIRVALGDGADVDHERRILGLTVSAAIVFVGNRLPKILTPLAMLPADLATRVTAARRFIGRVWVVLGATLAVAFLFAPLTRAVPMTRWVFGACMVTMLAGVIWMNAAPARRARLR